MELSVLLNYPFLLPKICSNWKRCKLLTDSRRQLSMTHDWTVQFERKLCYISDQGANGWVRNFRPRANLSRPNWLHHVIFKQPHSPYLIESAHNLALHKSYSNNDLIFNMKAYVTRETNFEFSLNSRWDLSLNFSVLFNFFSLWTKRFTNPQCGKSRIWKFRHN